MPKKPNYGFDKRRKEQDRKARKDAKIAERRQRRDGATEQEAADTQTADGNPNPDAATDQG